MNYVFFFLLFFIIFITNSTGKYYTNWNIFTIYQLCKIYTTIKLTRLSKYFFQTVLNFSTVENKMPNDEEKNLGEMNFVVSLRINKSHFASGCLISEYHVLTSASCAFYIYRHGGKFFEFATVYVATDDALRDKTYYRIRMIEHYPTYVHDNELRTKGFDLAIIMVSLLIRLGI